MKPEKFAERLYKYLSLGGKNPPFTNSDMFASLYRETHLAVFRYIYGLTGGPAAEVEDLTAETYLHAWKNRTGYQGDPNSAIGWVLRIARNLVIDDYRCSKNHPFESPLFQNENVLIAPPEQHPENQVLELEQLNLIVDQLNILQNEQREMLVLRYLLNWKVKQISQYLEIPENTISVNIHRSLEKLRSQWPVEKE